MYLVLRYGAFLNTGRVVLVCFAAAFFPFKISSHPVVLNLNVFPFFVLRPVQQVTRINTLSMACPLPAHQCKHRCSTFSLDKVTQLLPILANTVLQHQLQLVSVQLQAGLLITLLQICNSLQEVFYHQLCHKTLPRITNHQVTNRNSQQQQVL